MIRNTSFRAPVMEIEHTRFDLKRKNQVTGLKSADAASNIPFRRTARSVDLMMDKPGNNLENSESDEGLRLAGASTSVISNYGGLIPSTNLESYESTGEEANVLDSISNAIGTTVERKHPYNDAAAADAAGGAAGTSDDSSPKSLTLAVDNPASVPNQKILTCYYRTVPYEGNELTFVYVKRMGKTVNMNISRIPWLIQRLVYYYSLKGDN
ncbi:unnamed protein product, partial [Allacma fusca]